MLPAKLLNWRSETVTVMEISHRAKSRWRIVPQHFCHGGGRWRGDDKTGLCAIWAAAKYQRNQKSARLSTPLINVQHF